jgi:hypothetical protein
MLNIKIQDAQKLEMKKDFNNLKTIRPVQENVLIHIN